METDPALRETAEGAKATLEALNNPAFTVSADPKIGVTVMNPVVWFDVVINNQPVGRVTIQVNPALIDLF